jgi:hypothetical protein
LNNACGPPASGGTHLERACVPAYARVKPLVERFARSIRELGAFGAALYAMHRLLVGVSGGRARLVVYGLYAQPVGVHTYQAVRDDPRTTTRQITSVDPLARAFPRPSEIVEQRFAAGADCFVTLVDGRFAGHIWVWRTNCEEDEVRCAYRWGPEDQGVWDFDVYVEPAYRGGRALARMWKAVDSALGAAGVRWSFSRISLFNAASISTHARLGARPVGHAIFLIFGPVQICASTIKPYFHVCLDNKSRPELVLRAPISR